MIARKLLQMICVFVFLVQASYASTFIGNGGNAGDIELQITFSQLSRTLSEISSLGEDNQGVLCRCQDVMNAHKMCDSLSSLDQRQVYYCGDTLSAKAKEMEQLLNSKQGVQVVWTSELMSVNESSGIRDADAVANQQQNKIYLNRDQFLSLRDYERIYLLAHELGHLVQIEKKYLRDDDKVGPFKQDDGARRLLNSMAAAITMKSITNGQVGHYVQSIALSKNYKTNWLSVSLVQQSQADASTKFTPYSVDRYGGLSAAYRYQLNQQHGVSTTLKVIDGKADIFTSTKATRRSSLLSLQYNYRLFPFSDPMSTFGQSHFVLGIGYEAGSHELKLADDHSDITEKVSSGSPIASVQYFIPFDSGVWFQAGAAVTAHNYKFEEIGYKTEKVQSSLNLGASYGF